MVLLTVITVVAAVMTMVIFSWMIVEPIEKRSTLVLLKLTKLIEKELTSRSKKDNSKFYDNRDVREQIRELTTEYKKIDKQEKVQQPKKKLTKIT